MKEIFERGGGGKAKYYRELQINHPLYRRQLRRDLLNCAFVIGISVGILGEAHLMEDDWHQRSVDRAIEVCQIQNCGDTSSPAFLQIRRQLDMENFIGDVAPIAGSDAVGLAGFLTGTLGLAFTLRRHSLKEQEHRVRE